MKSMSLSRDFLLAGLSLLLLLSSLGSGFARHYRARLWQFSDGLPHNTVTALMQTRNGYIWVGTLNGLAKFDGVKFTPVNLPSIDGAGSYIVSALCEGLDGSIWVGTQKNGLYRHKDGRWIHYTEANGLAHNSVRSMIAARDGSIWIGTARGLNRFQEERFKVFGMEQGLADNVVRCLHEDANGLIWIGAGYRINRFENETLTTFEFDPNKAAPRTTIRALCIDSKGTLWIGFVAGLASVKDGRVSYYTRSRGLVDNIIGALYTDRAGITWIGTAGGLNRWVDRKLIAEVNNSGVSHDQVNAIMEDQEGNIWLGTRGGLCRLTPKPFVTYGREHGLSHNNVMSIYENKPGHFWVGTWGGGLNWMRDGTVSEFSTVSGLIEKLPADLILALDRDPSGHLWIGTDFSRGLFQLVHGKFNRFGSKEGLHEAVIRVICQDGEGSQWLGTSTALVRLKDEEFLRYTTAEGVAGNAIRAIIRGQHQSLWIGTESGLSRLKDGQFINYTKRDGLSDDFILGLYEDAAGDLWIATKMGGLNRLRDGKFTAYTMAQGLFQNEIFEILEDGSGFLWMSSLKGVFRVSKKELDDLDSGKTTFLNCTAYGERDGMASAQCNGVAKPSAWKASDGRLWFATIKGVAVVDPNFSRTNRVPPPVFIDAVFVDKHPLEVGSAGNSGTLTLKPGRGELDFHYTALSFRDPERVRFKCKLEGVDADWLDVGNQRRARYNNIFPGNYTFRVMASNDDGTWNEAGASLHFNLQPHFWQTWWFYSFLGFAGVGVVGGAARYTTRRKLQRKLELLEQQQAIEKERSRIAQDMHDQLGAGLTQVGLLGELAKRHAERPDQTRSHAQRICETARELAQTVDEIVWTVDPRNDTLNQLAAYIAVYAEDFLKAAPMRCRLDIPPGLPAIPISAELRHNLFLTIKEALNNIVKHAEASEATIRVALDGATLKALIQDDGKGFQSDALPPGNGLLNMKKRITDLGGRFSIESKPRSGTRLVIEIPLTMSRDFKPETFHP